MLRVEVHEYTPVWQSAFDEEAARLRAVFGSELIDMHHVGSTAVPGLPAKPIIDILAVVHEIGKIDEINQGMSDIGYECMGEFGIQGRRYFRKGADRRTHHVHVFANGDPNVIRHIAFRDYLRSHEQDRVAYGDLKLSLARLHPNDIDAYIDGKDSLVKVIERRALEWYVDRNSSRSMDVRDELA